MGQGEGAKYIPRFTKALDNYVFMGGKIQLQLLAIGNPN